MIWLLSLIWSSINGVRRRLYALGVFSGVRLPMTTLSVGNIEAGGTGKTPLVRELARRALARGRVRRSLTRGHGGAWSRSAGVIEPGDSKTDPSLCGDEAALVHSQIPGAWIGVGADRIRSFHRVMEIADERGLKRPDCVILDDGYQHLRIERDWDLVLLTSATRASRVHREWSPPKPGSGTVLIWSKGDVPPRGWQERTEGCYRLRHELPAPDAGEVGQKLWLVSGIGSPAEFEKAVRDRGWNVVRHTQFADHARYSADWLRDLFSKASGQGLVVATTGKDWVKWSALGFASGQARVFEPSLQFDPASISDRLFP